MKKCPQCGEETHEIGLCEECSKTWDAVNEVYDNCGKAINQQSKESK